MHHSIPRLIAVATCAATLIIPSASFAAAHENAVKDTSVLPHWTVNESAHGELSFHIDTPNLTLHSFQDQDTGTPGITSVITDPANRRYVYISVRIDHGSRDSGPFTTKVYRYDLETDKLVRIFRKAGGSGYNFLGFDGKKLLVVDAPYSDNNPGPCWWDQVLTEKTLTYIDVSKPQHGIKTYTPSKKFRALRAKAFERCSNTLQ